MTWFADLSPCTYHDWPGDRLAVGWLDVSHAFERGTIRPAARDGIFMERLFWAIGNSSVDRFRGFHPCQLCESAPGTEPASAERNGERLALGYAHVEVSAADGAARFVTPTLVYHYISEHGYRPPDAFIDAIILGDIGSEPRPVGELVHVNSADRTLDDPIAAQLVVKELARRLAADATSLERRITVTVTRAERVLGSIPEGLPSLCLWIDVNGPTRRRGWTEWAPTSRCTADAVERLFAYDPQLIVALEEAMRS